MLITKLDGNKEAFDSSKLRASLIKAGTSEAECDKVIQKIESELKEGMNTSLIYRRAYTLLKKQEKGIAARYSMKRAVLDLGPSGFPFEQFIAEIFKKWGYSTEVGKIIKGACAKHEIDLYAHKDGKNIAAEMKFHNKLGIKSDLKVALYVHARFEDIQANSSNTSPIDERWLVTNTKFTHNAIKYSKCVGLRTVSWSDPPSGNLNNLIEESGIQPLTSLTTLSKQEKRALMERDVVLCRSLFEKQDMMKSLGFSDSKIETVLSESRSLCGSRNTK
ncbi:ATPase [Patescibacteria group bacterium]|nr:ATPase [Patescibacteria group bacterium]